MTLAAVLVIYLSTWGSFRAPLRPLPLALQSQPASAVTQPQNPAPPTPDSSPAATTPNAQRQSSPPAAQAPASTQAPAKHRWHRKKTATPDPDCATSPAATKSPADGQTPNSTSNTDPAKATNGAAASKPCPTPKVVVKNGGSDEPTITLTGKTTAEQASQQRYNTEQLAAAAEANLKNITTRQLSPTQQEMVSQVKLFLEQSKKAVADGDLQRGHDFAVKAQLLSNELLKP
jgi:hypothetical protein